MDPDREKKDNTITAANVRAMKSSSSYSLHTMKPRTRSLYDQRIAIKSSCNLSDTHVKKKYKKYIFIIITLLLI